MFGDLLLFYPNKAEWRRLTLPNPPPPRSAHQAWATGGGDAALFVFGGEFTSPNGSSFYHYSDFWKLPLGVPLADMAWEKIEAPGGPSPRSGHRMTMFKRKLVVVRRAPPARTWRLRRGVAPHWLPLLVSPHRGTNRRSAGSKTTTGLHQSTLTMCGSLTWRSMPGARWRSPQQCSSQTRGPGSSWSVLRHTLHRFDCFSHKCGPKSARASTQASARGWYECRTLTCLPTASRCWTKSRNVGTESDRNHSVWRVLYGPRQGGCLQRAAAR